ncbi:hypothetical protein ABU186_08290 [Weissella paramesenteroides]
MITARVREYGMKAIVFILAAVLVAISMNSFSSPTTSFQVDSMVWLN